MGILDGALRGVAATLMGQFGTSAILRTATGGYDPATGVTTLAPTDVPVRGTLEAYPELQMLGGGRATDEGILRGDKKFTLAAQGVPKPKPAVHRLVIGDVVWNIVKVDPQMATDQAALYVLQVRR
jgi:hypothetical protein